MIVRGKHLRVVESITIFWELDVDSGRVLLKSHPPQISSYLATQDGLPLTRLYDVKETSLLGLERVTSQKVWARGLVIFC